jgi:hypothetical protein
VRRAIALLLIAALAAAAGCGGEDRQGTARAAAERFLDGYVEPDGRVVRRDQGGDTVSEGQAYAMLLAAAIGDERRFDLAWTWARDHLRRPDGLLAWHWDDGQVVDGEPASDADLDAARALLLAARRFGRPSLGEEGRRLGDAIRRNEAVGDLVVAGPWARAEAVVNPSYLSPRAFDALGWRGASASARRALEGLKEPLPPDWARLEGHALTPTGPPGSDEPAVYGYDAARLPLRLASRAPPRTAGSRRAPGRRCATTTRSRRCSASTARHARRTPTRSLRRALPGLHVQRATGKPRTTCSTAPRISRASARATTAPPGWRSRGSCWTPTGSAAAARLRDRADVAQLVEHFTRKVRLRRIREALGGSMR